MFLIFPDLLFLTYRLVLFFCTSSTVNANHNAYCSQRREVNEPLRGKKFTRLENEAVTEGGRSSQTDCARERRGLQATNEGRSITRGLGK